MPTHLTKEEILKLADKKDVRTAELAKRFDVSRQYAHMLVGQLVAEGKLMRVGPASRAVYTTLKRLKESGGLPSVKLTLANRHLEEHEVLRTLERILPAIRELPENVHSIFFYAFSEMLNNAIEHSCSKKITVEVSLGGGNANFAVIDHGIGVFRNVMKSRKLASELEAIQDILKGKTTTEPRAHSGEGIFFTSKAGDLFRLESFGHELTVDNTIPDVFITAPGASKSAQGTKVTFRISEKSKRHLNEVFNKYANIDEESDYGFDRTEILVKLYAKGGFFVSRSQARRILAGLEKFKSIILDFDKVPMVGQAFADEVFRVFKNKHPKIEIKPVNMENGVEFMVRRVAGK